jgi:hypothetical protein
MFRNQHDIPVFAVGSARPWLTIEEFAMPLGVSVAVVRTTVKQGQLPARQSTRGVPWMIERNALTRREVVARVRDAKLGRKVRVRTNAKSQCLAYA